MAVAKKIDEPVDTLPGPVRAIWMVSVQNLDPEDSTVVDVTDALPTGVEYVAHSMKGPATCTVPSPGGSGSIECQVRLAPASSWELYIEVETSTAGVYVNQVHANIAVEISDKAEEVDPDRSNNSASSTWTVRGTNKDKRDEAEHGGGSGNEGYDCCKGIVRFDAQVTKDVLQEEDPGERLFRLTVYNNGAEPISFLILRDSLPESLEFLSVDAPDDVACFFSDDAIEGGGQLGCIIPHYADPKDPRTWFQPGQRRELVLRTRLLESGSGCENVAELETWRFAAVRDPGKEGDRGEDPPPSGEGREDRPSDVPVLRGGGKARDDDDHHIYIKERFDDQVPENNVAWAKFHCNAVPVEESGGVVLQIDKQAEVTEVLVGEEFTYRLVYRNLGDEAATDVIVTDDVPNGLAIVSVSDGCAVSGQRVTCVDPRLPSGVERAFLVTVVPSFEGRFVNEARVTRRDADPEVSDGPNILSDQAEVVVRRSATPGEATPGGSTTGIVTTGTTSTARLPTTGWSPWMGLLAISLVAIGAGLVLATDTRARPALEVLARSASQRPGGDTA